MCVVKRDSAVDPAATRRRVFDAVLAFLLALLNLVLVAPFVARGRPNAVGPAVALLLVHGGCLAWRREAPLVVLGIVLGSGLIVVALGWPSVVLGVAALVALYSVAAHREPRRSLPALGVTIGSMAVGLLILSRGSDTSTIVGNALVLAVVWYLGESVRARRAHIAQLEQRTEELERAREELAASAVAGERLRIARELHDVVAHSLGVIAVQAGVGAHVIETNPREAKRSLEAIEQASKSALAEIRGLLGLLRSDDDEAGKTPAPRISDLRVLADEMAAAGVDVDLELDSAVANLAPSLELTIFRVIQEALTNVVRHARASRATVMVARAADGLRIEVVDDGRAQVAPSGGGHGLVGMRERVGMHGGTLTAGPLEGGGFKVAVSIPLESRT